MFEIGRQSLADCKRIAVVGDNLASDIAGAKRSGLEAIIVLTGIATEPDLIAAEHQPDLVLASLADLAAGRASVPVSPAPPTPDGATLPSSA